MPRCPSSTTPPTSIPSPTTCLSRSYVPNEIMPLRKDLVARGYSLERFVARVRYARNGNVGNPSKEWTWVLKRHGEIVGTAHTKRAALEMAEM